MHTTDLRRRVRIQKFRIGDALTDQIEDVFDLRDAVSLGSGSLGEAFRATDKATQEKVVLKLVSEERLAKVGLQESRLRQEVSILNELNHPNIIRLVDVVVGSAQLDFSTCSPPYVCIVTECIGDADPLSELIRPGGDSVNLAWRVLHQLVDALALIHSKGIVHRDVWSENVLLNKQGRAVLLDFGSAEYVDSQAAGHFLNLPYMSPESVAGGLQNPSDDVWSLGILLTEVATGSFVTDRLASSSVPLCQKPGCLAEAIVQTTSKGSLALGRLAARLLQMNSQDRPTMQEVLAQLRTPNQQGLAASSTVSSSAHVLPLSASSLSLPGRQVGVIKENAQSLSRSPSHGPFVRSHSPTAPPPRAGSLRFFPSTAPSPPPPPIAGSLRIYPSTAHSPSAPSRSSRIFQSTSKSPSDPPSAPPPPPHPPPSSRSFVSSPTPNSTSKAGSLRILPSTQDPPPHPPSRSFLSSPAPSSTSKAGSLRILPSTQTSQALGTSTVVRQLTAPPQSVTPVPQASTQVLVSAANGTLGHGSLQLPSGNSATSQGTSKLSELRQKIKKMQGELAEVKASIGERDSADMEKPLPRHNDSSLGANRMSSASTPKLASREDLGRAWPASSTQLRFRSQERVPAAAGRT